MSPLDIVLEPHYSELIYAYNFPETFLRARSLEKLRRKFFLAHVRRTLTREFGEEILGDYSLLSREHRLVTRIRELSRSIPRPRFGGFSRPEDLYAIVRRLRPELVVETGVGYGASSAFILQALEDNEKGLLYSIDLPGQFAEETQVGLCVPSSLLPRWHLALGDARSILPSLLDEIGSIDAFFHDSLHTYDHMMFEFQHAWSHLRNSGYLLADNTDLNPSFPNFCRMMGVKPTMLYSTFGFTRKQGVGPGQTS